MKRATEFRSLREKEKLEATRVFKNHVPYHKVLITDGLGAYDRPFTLPPTSGLWPFLGFGSEWVLELVGAHPGKYQMNVGDAYYHDMSVNTAYRDLLIHELTHVWQGERDPSRWQYVFNSAWHQLRSRDKAYDYRPKLGGPWNDFNAEQQAQLVEDWYSNGRKEGDELFEYVRVNIWGETPMLPPIRDLESGTIPQYVMDEGIIERNIVSQLERRIGGKDLAAAKDRVQRLSELFYRVTKQQAVILYPKLQVRQATDRLSRLFFDVLSESSRKELRGILEQTIKGS